jgi:hypothetical protein
MLDLGCGSMIECLPSLLEALGLISSNEKKKKKDITFILPLGHGSK